MKTYKSHVELNGKQSPSTGCCTAYYGKSPWKNLKGAYMFFELSDCSGKVRLHNSQLDTKEQFISKLKKLDKELKDFIEFLERA